MADVARIDESSLLWAAALVTDADPADLVGAVDLGVLAAIVAATDAADDAVDAAAHLLVRVVGDQPFPMGNAAVGWLAAVDLLAEAGYAVTARRSRIVRLCNRIRQGTVDPSAVATQLRTWAIAQGVACPVCDRRVYAARGADRRTLMPGTSAFELVARCSYEHGHHDRFGRETRAELDPRPGSLHPVLARGDCGSFLVAGDGTCLVVSPYCDDPPAVRVVEVDDVRPADLVGRWDALVQRSRTLGFVRADAVAPDDRGCVDVRRIRQAVRAGRPAQAAAEDERLELSTAGVARG